MKLAEREPTLALRDTWKRMVGITSYLGMWCKACWAKSVGQKKNWIPLTQGCFESSLVEIGLVVLEKKIFFISSMYFDISLLSPFWKRAGSFIWINLNSLHPRMLYAKFGRNWPSGCGEEDFLISFMYFHNFLIISP